MCVQHVHGWAAAICSATSLPPLHTLAGTYKAVCVHVCALLRSKMQAPLEGVCVFPPRSFSRVRQAAREDVVY